MTAIEQIKAAKTAKLVDEDGDSVELELKGPLALEQIDALRSRWGFRCRRNCANSWGFVQE